MMEFSEDARERFFRYVSPDEDGCWLWAGYVMKNGYGLFSVGAKKSGLAHRAAYELLAGPIPKGLVIDHLCRVRNCVNPQHLEVVTMRENLRRGDSPAARRLRQTHCKRGHPFNKENTRRYKTHRLCRTCIRKYKSEYEKQKRREKRGQKA